MFKTLETATEEIVSIRRQNLRTLLNQIPKFQDDLAAHPGDTLNNAYTLGYLSALIAIEGITPPHNWGWIKTLIEMPDDYDSLGPNGDRFIRAQQALNKLTLEAYERYESI